MKLLHQAVYYSVNPKDTMKGREFPKTQSREVIIAVEVPPEKPVTE